MSVDSSAGASSGGGGGGGIRINPFKAIRKPLTPEQQNQKLKDVAQMYEKQFLREMMKQMRSTVTEGGFMPANHAEKIFRGQLDEEYVEKWGDRGGIGLADMVHKQLLEKLGPALGITQAPVRPHGPIKMDEKSLLNNPLRQTSPKGASDLALQINLQEAQQNKAISPEVTSPWSGTLLDGKKLSADEYLIDVQHENGLKSRMMFQGKLDLEGQTLETLQGQKVESGQRIGWLSPLAENFFWTVSKSK